MLSSIKVIYF